MVYALVKLMKLIMDKKSNFYLKFYKYVKSMTNKDISCYNFCPMLRYTVTHNSKLRNYLLCSRTKLRVWNIIKSSL